MISLHCFYVLPSRIVSRPKRTWFISEISSDKSFSVFCEVLSVSCRKMACQIQRNSNCKYPRVYDEFEINSSGRCHDGSMNKSTKLIIKDLTAEHYDAAADIIMQNHGLVSVSYRAAGILSTDDDRRETKARYKRAFEENISLICVVEATNQIVGVNGLCIKTREILQQPKVSGHMQQCYHIWINQKPQLKF